LNTSCAFTTITSFSHIYITLLLRVNRGLLLVLSAYDAAHSNPCFRQGTLVPPQPVIATPVVLCINTICGPYRYRLIYNFVSLIIYVDFTHQYFIFGERAIIQDSPQWLKSSCFFCHFLPLSVINLLRTMALCDRILYFLFNLKA